MVHSGHTAGTQACSRNRCERIRSFAGPGSAGAACSAAGVLPLGAHHAGRECHHVCWEAGGGVGARSEQARTGLHTQALTCLPLAHVPCISGAPPVTPPDVSSMILAVGLPAPCPALTSTRVSRGLRCGESAAPAGWRGEEECTDRWVEHRPLQCVGVANTAGHETASSRLASRLAQPPPTHTCQHVLQRGCQLVGVQRHHTVVVVWGGSRGAGGVGQEAAGGLRRQSCGACHCDACATSCALPRRPSCWPPCSTPLAGHPLSAARTTGGDEEGGVLVGAARGLRHVVDGRVAQQHGEVLLFVGAAVVGDPGVPDCELVEAQHVHHPHLRQHHLRQRRQATGCEEAGAAAAVDARLQQGLRDGRTTEWHFQGPACRG